MQHTFSLIVIILSLSIGATASLAQEVIVPVNHYPPWRIVNTSEDIGGINIKLMDTLLSKIGLKATYVVRPWKRGQRMMKTGTADIMNGLLKNKEREESMIFLAPPYKTKSTKAFYVLKNSQIKINSYNDLYKYKIGVSLGSHFFPQFDNDVRLTKDSGNDALNNLIKLKFHRIDTFIMTETVGDYLCNKEEYRGLFKKAEYKYNKPLAVYFAVSKKSPLAQRVPELNAALKGMVESGQAQKIITEFIYGKNYTN
ncbi:transporter substrate-binding domain-containing protein [Maridesulfovibrio sp.]|uniref:substrate-binding periplasmic protein n=1 Tax=Maridesulfovibrio sp. TaxID=2795000 RepID=UPI0029F5981A|nr:transporter substrate-binding domain-containing protein [Maridesulfovibrio sp.]